MGMNLVSSINICNTMKSIKCYLKQNMRLLLTYSVGTFLRMSASDQDIYVSYKSNAIILLLDKLYLLIKSGQSNFNILTFREKIFVSRFQTIKPECVRWGLVDTAELDQFQISGPGGP